MKNIPLVMKTIKTYLSYFTFSVLLLYMQYYYNNYISLGRPKCHILMSNTKNNI